MTMRKFIGGKYEGTNLEIMPSKKAEKLPDGTPILWRWTSGDQNLNYLSPTQKRHNEGKLDVHAPQVFDIFNENDKTTYRYEGPSIAQEWKILHRGERPFYRNMGRA